MAIPPMLVSIGMNAAMTCPPCWQLNADEILRSRALRSVLFNTDCEGPTVANDHALEAAAHWLPDGGRLFRQLSNFDDYLAYVTKRPFYNAGDTLRLMLPFLRAVGVTDEGLERWTREPQKIQWISGAQDAIKCLLSTQNIEVFEISASYYPFAALVAEELGIAPDRVYSTFFSLNRYHMESSEVSRLKELAMEIVMLPDVPEIDLKTHIRGPSEFSEEDLEILARLETIVWDEMAQELPCSSQMLGEIRAMGGLEKAHAVQDAIERTQLDPANTIYVGDSITDVEAFIALDGMGGMSVSFNGNQHAVDHATLCLWGDTSLVSALVAGVFRDGGREGLQEFVDAGSRRRQRLVPSELLDVYSQLIRKDWGIALRSQENRDRLLSESIKYRRETREAAAAASS
jgi:energy-converting hydrogenase A subunit R